MPLLGPAPGLDRAWLATGHGTKGIHLAAVSARIMADYITGRPIDAEIPAEAFLPERFAAAVA
jgi:D-amino-acid dehydrogenase